jgi:hypothetical protein
MSNDNKANVLLDKMERVAEELEKISKGFHDNLENRAGSKYSDLSSVIEEYEGPEVDDDCEAVLYDPGVLYPDDDDYSLEYLVQEDDIKELDFND